MPERSNILVIFADQLSARWLPCCSGDKVRTPNLDRFAADSVNFTRAYTCSPLCSPYRASLLTGLYPTQHGVVENGMRLPADAPTLADALNGAGYATHYIGKWHLGGPPGGNHWVPPQKRGGFQQFIGWESHHVDHWDGLVWADDPDAPVELEGHETDGLTDLVCRELESLDETPFYMVVSYQAPHPPCSPPDTFRSLYRGKPLTDEPNADGDARFHRPAWDEDCGIRDFRERYFAETTQLDHALGRLLDALDRLGLASNTVVVFTSDHGDMAGAHGLFGKGVMYEEAVHVPLLVRVPGRGRGRRLDVPVSTVDLLPTLLELAGGPLIVTAEGRSLAGALKHGDPLEEQPVFIEYHGHCVVDGASKLIAEPDGKPVALYDLRADPWELENLVDEPGESSRVDQLLGELQQWRSRIGPRV